MISRRLSQTVAELIGWSVAVITGYLLVNTVICLVMGG